MAFSASSIFGRWTVVLRRVQEKANKTKSSHSRAAWEGREEGKITKHQLLFRARVSHLVSETKPLQCRENNLHLTNEETKKRKDGVLIRVG